MSNKNISNIISELYCTGYYDHALELCNKNPNAYNSEIIGQFSQICLGKVSDTEVLCLLDSEDPNLRAIALHKQIEQLRRYSGKIPEEHRKMLLGTLQDLSYYADSGILPESLAILSDAYLELDEGESALKLLERQNASATRSMEVYAHLKLKNWSLALEKSKRLLKDFVSSPTALLACAYASFSSGKWSEGVEHLKTAENLLVKLDPVPVEYSESPLFANAKAIGHIAVKDYAKAITDLKRRDDQTSLANLVTCYWNNQNEDKAEEAFETLKKKYPNGYMVHVTESIKTAMD